MPAAWGTGMATVGQAMRQGSTLQRYRCSPIWAATVPPTLVIASPQCTPPRNDRMVAP
jgi:hypothetical protein